RDPARGRRRRRAHRARVGVLEQRRLVADAVLADRRRDERHLQRRRLHLALADRRRADRQIVADLVRRRDRRGRLAREDRVLVEAELLRGGDEVLRAQLRAERREDAVAGVRERAAQRAAARLAVGVLDL